MNEGELFYMITWQQPARPLLLASGSPRRRELLEKMGYTFTVASGAPINEQSFITTGDLEGSLCQLALAKGAEVAETNPKALVLSADTIVVCENLVQGKPRDRTNARQMLQRLSGKRHRVLTSVALVCREIGFSRATAATTSVFFRDLSNAEIDWYLATEEPYDKAGAYGIQGHAMVFVDKIEGCFYNVVGLPVSCTIDLFKAFDARKDLNNDERN
jgi:septum formation protein